MILSMITENSAEKGADFEAVWVSSLQVPYRAIILVDDSDTPRTREFVKRFADTHGKELVVEGSRLYGWHKPTRATARQTAIDIFFEQFSDEWLFFLDDDFILRSGWWNEAQGYVEEPRVGLVWGIDYTPRWRERAAWVRARGFDEVTHAIENFKVRGGLHDTLLRRRAVEGIKIPPWLNVFEDAWVKKYVECRGWEWRIVETGGDHLRGETTGGYERADLYIMAYVSSALRLEPVSWRSFLETLLGLPGYVYYSAKAYGLRLALQRGIDKWRQRVVYRWLLLRHRRNEDPCHVVLTNSLPPPRQMAEA